MAQIILNAGTLAPPACYANDQERLEAFVAAIVASISGGIQWEAGSTAPVDLTAYWLQTDANARPIAVRKYVAASGRWEPPIPFPLRPDSVGGSGDAITLSNTPTFNSSSAFLTGRRFVFLAPADNTGAVTLAVDGLTAKPVVKHSGTALEAGDILDGQIVDVVYNLAADWWELQTPTKAFVLSAASVRDLITEGTGPVPGAGSSSTISHAVGEVPAWWTLRLRCKTSEAGYSVDDEADPISVLTDQGSGSWIPAFSYSISDTAVTILRHSQSHTDNSRIKIHSKSSPSTPIGATFTPDNWEFVLRTL